MSKGRMRDLQDALQQAGWEILNRDALFSIEDEVITWRCCHQLHNTNIELEFHVFGDLGQSSNNLNDILYCVVRGYGLELLFETRNTNEWKSNLTEFVQALGRIPLGP
jgi:hypothetical protein